jgi:hypothetical protein
MFLSRFSIFKKLFFRIDKTLLKHRKGIYLIGIASGKKIDKKKQTPNANWFANTDMYSSLQRIIDKRRL